MVICLERGADLHVVQRMPLPLTVSCFSEIQIGFTFLVPAHPGSPGKRAVKRVCVFFASGGTGALTPPLTTILQTFLAEVLLNSVIYTVSVPSIIENNVLFMYN